MKSDQLYESIFSHHNITCDICSITELVTCCDELDAVEHFYYRGWRARKKTYCPKCVKEKLKNKE